MRDQRRRSGGGCPCDRPEQDGESGSAGFYPGPNTGSCVATYTGSDVLSGDTYAITNSYLDVGKTGTACLSGSSTVPSDCLWLYGLQTQNMLATSAGINKPTWVDIESGTDFEQLLGGERCLQRDDEPVCQGQRDPRGALAGQLGLPGSLSSTARTACCGSATTR